MQLIEFKPLLLTDKADIFSIRVDNSPQSEFDKFYDLYKDQNNPYLKDDLERILATIKAIGERGVLENQFRPEGEYADRVFALPLLILERNKKKFGTLRLYCLRYSTHLLILGGGGIKNVQAYEDDPVLSSQVELLQKIDHQLTEMEQVGIDIPSEIYNLTLTIN